MEPDTLACASAVGLEDVDVRYGWKTDISWRPFGIVNLALVLHGGLTKFLNEW